MAAKWSWLRAVENYRVVKSMYVWLFIVPIAAKATALIEGTATFTVFQYEFQVEIGLPFSWEAFYFSAWAFVIGNLIVIMRCPKIIMENSDYSAFKLQGKGRTHVFSYWEDIGGSAEDFGMMWGMGQVREEYIEVVRESIQADTFWTIYKDAQDFRLIGRVLCLLSYIVGFVLIAFVLLQNLIYVVRFLMSV